MNDGFRVKGRLSLVLPVDIVFLLTSFAEVSAIWFSIFSLVCANWVLWGPIAASFSICSPQAKSSSTQNSRKYPRMHEEACACNSSLGEGSLKTSTSISRTVESSPVCGLLTPRKGSVLGAFYLQRSRHLRDCLVFLIHPRTAPYPLAKTAYWYEFGEFVPHGRRRGSCKGSTGNQ